MGIDRQKIIAHYEYDILNKKGDLSTDLLIISGCYALDLLSRKIAKEILSGGCKYGTSKIVAKEKDICHNRGPEKITTYGSENYIKEVLNDMALTHPIIAKIPHKISQVGKKLDFEGVQHLLKDELLNVFKLSKQQDLIVDEIIKITYPDKAAFGYMSNVGYLGAYLQSNEHYRYIIPKEITPKILANNLIDTLTVDNLTSYLVDEQMLVTIIIDEISYVLGYYAQDDPEQVQDGDMVGAILCNIYTIEDKIIRAEPIQLPVLKNSGSMPIKEWLSATVKTIYEGESSSINIKYNTIWKALQLSLSSRLMVQCEGIDVKEDLYIKKVSNKEKRELRKAKKTPPIYKFVDISKLRFKPSKKQKVDKTDKPGTSKCAHMRSGHFRNQRYKNEKGEWEYKVIFIAPIAVRGWKEGDKKPLVFNVVNFE